jgi:glycerophosphoryl diester phosphodiesterase
MDSRIQHLSPQDFLVIAHRGASSYAPENTIAAFDLALQMGARHLELDVHLTRDDYLVIIHDDTSSWTQYTFSFCGLILLSSSIAGRR